MSYPSTKEIYDRECPECSGQCYQECCPQGGAVQWPEIPMCSVCKEWSIDPCDFCKGTGVWNAEKVY